MVQNTNKDTTRFKADIRQRLNTAFNKLDAANSVENIGRDEIKGESIISRGMQAVSIIPKVFGISMPTKIMSKVANYDKDSKFVERMGNLNKVSTGIDNRSEFVGQLVDNMTQQYENMRDEGTLPKVAESTAYRKVSDQLNGKGLANALTSPNYEKVDDIHPEAKLFSEIMVTMLFDGSLLAELEKPCTQEQQSMSHSERMVAIVSEKMASKFGLESKIAMQDVMTGHKDATIGLNVVEVSSADKVAPMNDRDGQSKCLAVER